MTESSDSAAVQRSHLVDQIVQAMREPHTDRLCTAMIDRYHLRAAGPEHTHRWFMSGDKRPGQWITETCTQFHPESKICPAPAPKGGCAHKPRC